MRRFVCQICCAEVSFPASECPNCGTGLGYFPADADLLPLIAVGSVAYTAPTSPLVPVVSWRCLNHAWGCNWMLPADRGEVWCESCRLTRGRPDESSIDAVVAWSEAERVKRRLIVQLRTLGLPIHAPAEGTTDGVVFDLVYLPDSKGVTGHRPGLVTLDLREVDGRYREAARIQFAEADRTLLGHLRHEIGHHYFDLLVVRPGAIDEFRTLFGDERADYTSALERHYERLGEPVADEFISAYAAAHPSEDWAEAFTHYLHLRDGLETADAFEIEHPRSRPEPFPAMLARWRRITAAVNEINVGLGHASPYPFDIGPRVEPKLAFVHRSLLQRSVEV